MNNLNMDPSLNLIFGDHALASFDSTYSQPIDIYEIELGITILFSFVYALFFFTFSSVSSFFFFLECWVSCLGWPS